SRRDVPRLVRRPDEPSLGAHAAASIGHRRAAGILPPRAVLLPEIGRALRALRPPCGGLRTRAGPSAHAPRGEDAATRRGASRLGRVDVRPDAPAELTVDFRPAAPRATPGAPARPRGSNATGGPLGGARATSRGSERGRACRRGGAIRSGAIRPNRGAARGAT